MSAAVQIFSASLDKVFEQALASVVPSAWRLAVERHRVGPDRMFALETAFAEKVLNFEDQINCGMADPNLPLPPTDYFGGEPDYVL
jgi:hypothetical protein